MSEEMKKRIEALDADFFRGINERMRKIEDCGDRQIAAYCLGQLTKLKVMGVEVTEADFDKATEVKTLEESDAWVLEVETRGRS